LADAAVNGKNIKVGIGCSDQESAV